ncbi:MAG: carbonic anhydrase family protein [Rhodocyclaceae bacterium]|nr:carbonic anhydrase family protein [Rhodocyclaceae bacterium]
MPAFARLSLSLLLSIAATSHADEAVHWAYDGHGGPDHWAELSSDFAMCGMGRNQSPVDLVAPVEASLSGIDFDYPLQGNEIINNGHTVQVNVAPGSSIRVDDHRYLLKQVHFHTPSENRINGKSFAAEAHFVHADAAGNLAVVAVLFDDGDSSPALAALDPELPDHAGEHHSLRAGNAIAALLPETREYFEYSGSLTTPPCSEGVRWLVMKQPMTISPAQRETLARVMHGPNNRPVQPLNARLVLD